MMTAAEIKETLKLVKHPVEGGVFRRTFASAGTIDTPRGTRPHSTAIYYMLEESTNSEMHVLDSDEMFHFYLGDPVEVLLLHKDGSSGTCVLGQDLAAGQHVQLLVPAGVWQGMRLVEGGKVALMGCTVTPGFNYSDYHNARYEELAAKWPERAEMIRALTRS